MSQVPIPLFPKLQGTHIKPSKGFPEASLSWLEVGERKHPLPHPCPWWDETDLYLQFVTLPLAFLHKTKVIGVALAGRARFSVIPLQVLCRQCNG